MLRIPKIALPPELNVNDDVRTVYRTAAVVEKEPCGACVHDTSRPHLRTGYPDPVSPMMMRCDACGDSWIDPALNRRANETKRMLDALSKQTEAMTRAADEAMARMQKNTRELRIVIVALTIFVIYVIYFLSRL